MPQVTLKPLLDLSKTEWNTLHSLFRNPVLAEWNGAKPLRMPAWIFRMVMRGEERSGDRAGFGLLNEAGQLIGTAELYDFRPSPPLQATTATLGIMVAPEFWGRGYGQAGVRELLRWGFSIHEPALQRIRLTTFGHNHRAQRAFATCGFQEVGRREKIGRTEVYMELERAQWRTEL